MKQIDILPNIFLLSTHGKQHLDHSTVFMAEMEWLKSY